MGQVPKQQKKIGVIGDGRMAQHAIQYFRLLNIPFQQWSRKISQEFCEALTDRLLDCDPVLVLIKDSEIDSFIRTHAAFFRGKKVVHFSGSLRSELAEGAHPLMTFGDFFYSLEEYKKIPFILEKGGTPFKELFPDLPNPHFAIDAEGKGLYHSLCVMSGNFTTLLWQKFFREMESQFNIPKEVLMPYLVKTMSNLISRSDTALTGPLARGDFGTLRKNLDALDRDSYQNVFRAFVEAHSPEFSETEAG